MLRSFFAHYHRHGVVERVLVAEIASTDQRDTHRVEVAFAYRTVDHIELFVGRWIGNAFDADRH